MKAKWENLITSFYLSLAVPSPYLTFLGWWYPSSYLSSPALSLLVSVSSLPFALTSCLLSLWWLFRETDIVWGTWAAVCVLAFLSLFCPACPVLTITWQHLGLKPLRNCDLLACDESFVCSVYFWLVFNIYWMASLCNQPSVWPGAA